MAEIHSEAPYYDDYQKSKNYVQLLAVPGNGEQAREFIHFSQKSKTKS